MRARVVASAAVAAGTLASAWALTPLFQRTSWFSAAALLVVAVALSGILAREWFERRFAVPIVQFVTLVLVTGWVFHNRPPGQGLPGRTGSTLFLGLPTPDTVVLWRDFFVDAMTVLRSNAAPVPTTQGVSFLLAVAIGLLALAADLEGATLELPALAALPMLAPYLTAVANGNGALPWLYFVAPAMAWLALLTDSDHRVRRRWLSEDGDRNVERTRWAGAFGLGGVALLIAVLLAQALPQLPVRYLAEGLGRGGVGGGGVVGFSTDLDLRTHLRATDQTPVLRYRTDDPAPAPLRVLVAERFTGQGWDQQKPSAQPTQGPHLPSTGYDGLVETTRHAVTVERTTLEAPHVAAPFPIADGSMTDAQWAVDERTGLAIVDRTPSSYRLEYVVPKPSPSQLSRASAAGAVGGGPELDTLALSPQDEQTIRDAMRGVVPEDADPYAAAVAIQNWLRSSAFTYSLDGVPEPGDLPSGGSGAAGEPSLLSRFLQVKRGYCTHFATTMVLAARERGIPARMAYGFLPGARIGSTSGPGAEGEYEVRRSDAHAWPELYFPETGWLRLEPTPGSRTGGTPAYAPGPSATAVPTLPTGSITTSASANPTGSATTGPRDRDRDRGSSAAGEAVAQAQGPNWWPVPVVMVAIALASLLMPLAARWARRRDLARAADDAERAEVEWDYLTSALADLGWSPPAGRTLGEQRAYYAGAAVLDERALRTVGETVERARYAPPGSTLPDLSGPADRVRRSAGELRPWWRRARAWLWPRYGVTALRRTFKRRRS